MAMNLLTIGNSFTDSLDRFLIPVARAANCAIHFALANFGDSETVWRGVPLAAGDAVLQRESQGVFQTL